MNAAGVIGFLVLLAILGCCMFCGIRAIGEDIGNDVDLADDPELFQ